MKTIPPKIAVLFGFLLCLSSVRAATNVSVSVDTNVVPGTTSVELSWELTTTVTNDVRIYLGTNNQGTNASSWADVVLYSGQLNGSVTATIHGLGYGRTYYARLHASNAVEDVWADTTWEFVMPRPALVRTGVLEVSVYNGRWGDDQLDPISTLLNVNPNGTYVFENPIAYSVNTYNNFVYFDEAFPALNSANNFCVAWEATLDLFANTTGTYTFATLSDNGSVWYVDLNRDGDFADAGELIVDNNGQHSRETRTGEVTFLEPGEYPMVIGYYEKDGAELMEARWAAGAGLTYDELTVLDPHDPTILPLRGVTRSNLLEIVHGHVSDIRSDAATFNAIFYPYESSWDLTVLYGPTDGGTNLLSWSNSVSAGTVSLTPEAHLQTLIQGLDASNRYWVSWVASNEFETVWADRARSFDTLPSVSTDSGPVAGVGTALLRGEVNTFADAPLILVWGAVDGGTSTSAWENVVNLGTVSTGDVSHVISQVYFGVDYYYRLYLPGIDAWSSASTPFSVQDPLTPCPGVAWLSSTNVTGGGIMLDADATTNTLDFVLQKGDPSMLSWDDATPHHVTIEKDGDYFLAFTLPMYNRNTQTNGRSTCIRAELFVDGVPMGDLGAVGESSFILSREWNVNRYGEGSDHFATLVPGLTKGSTLEIRVNSSLNSQLGLARMQQASLYVEHLGPERKIFSATTSDGGQDMTPAAERDVAWETVDRETVFATLVTSSNLVLRDAGDYLLFVNLPYTSGQQWDSARVQIKLDGDRVPGGWASQGHIRRDNGHASSSVHWSGMVQASATGQVLSVSVMGDPRVTNHTAVVAGGRMSLMLEKVETGSEILFNEKPEYYLLNWNQDPPLDLDWDVNNIIDTNAFAHNPTQDAHLVTLKDGGNYFMVYNDSLITRVIRPNPLVAAELDGVRIPGAEVKTHFCNNDTVQSESSGSLVFMLQDVSPGADLGLSSRQERMPNGIAPYDSALLYVKRIGAGGTNLPVLLSSTGSVHNSDSLQMQAELMGSNAVYNMVLHWGATDGGTESSHWDERRSIATTNLTGTVRETISGLEAKTYYFAWQATNSEREVWSETASLSIPEADVAIQKSVDVSTLIDGSNLTYSITVTNIGVIEVGSYHITDALPVGLDFLGSDPVPTVLTNGVAIYNASGLAVGSSTTLTLYAGVNDAAAVGVTNFAYVGGLSDTSTNDNLDLAVTLLPDFDTDGDPDFRDDDDDNDRMDDEDERIAGTDVYDDQSFLWMELSATNDAVSVRFPSVVSRVYQIDAVTNLDDEVWTTLTNRIHGTGDLLDVPLDTNGSIQMLRLGAELDD